jgi:hypothetical protein
LEAARVVTSGFGEQVSGVASDHSADGKPEFGPLRGSGANIEKVRPAFSGRPVFSE